MLKSKNINPVTNGYLSEKYKKFRKNKNFFSLPMFNPEIVSEIKDKLMNSDILILEAQTGAGKSVIAPFHIMEIFNYHAKILMSEPRTVNAISIAEALSMQLDGSVGDYVGYMTGSANKVSEKTMVTVMTDALLMMYLLKELENYDVIIVDEVHERNVNIDICLAIIKKYLYAVQTDREDLEVLQKYENMSIKDKLKHAHDISEFTSDYYDKDLHPRTLNPVKFVLLSATLDVEKFKTYFHKINVKHMFVEGRTYPITNIFYEDLFSDPIVMPDSTYKIIDKLLAEEEGDILVFLPGKAFILEFIEKYKDHEGLLVGGIYRGINDKELLKLTSKTKYQELGFTRRLLFSTNIAETGVTIDGLKFVIDTGYEKKMIITNNYLELESDYVSKSSVKQRCGRVGRTGPGTCYHVYEKEQYNEFNTNKLPDIYSTDLNDLLIKLLPDMNNISVVEEFLTDAIMDPIPKENLAVVLNRYFTDGIIDYNGLTEVGLFVSKFPISYKYLVMIKEGYKYNIPEIVIPIAAMMSCGSFRDFTTSNKYKNSMGDIFAYFLLFMDVLHKFQLKPKEFLEFCGQNKLNGTLLLEAKEKILDIEKKVNEFIQSRKSNTEIFGTWKIVERELFKSESNYKDKEVIIALLLEIFGKIFPKRLVYLNYKSMFSTEDGILISKKGISNILEISEDTKYIGYEDILKINNSYIVLNPFVVL